MTRTAEQKPGRPTPGPVRIRRSRAGQRLANLVSDRREQRHRPPAREAVTPSIRWRGRRRLAVIRWISYAGAALLVLWLLRAFVVVFVLHRPVAFPFSFNPDDGCRPVASSCGALTGIVVSWLSLAAATALFLVGRLRRVVNHYGSRAEEHPSELVPTAAAGIVGDVVGRDDLCHVIVEDLRDSEDRRPHILIGGVGAGKTAVLVLLTEMLARAGATPVPIRLRDAQDVLDFEDLARKKFLSEVDTILLSQSEGDRIWRYLRKNDRIVVLADGLEEALSPVAKDRDNIIRLAIVRARDARLPLVIASRPHDPLRGADAAILELEPLSRMAALDYLGEEDPGEDRRRLNWIVETADVAEAPLFLRITRDLHGLDLLRQLTPGVKARGVNTRSLDRSALRLNLLDTWLSALIDGRLCGDVPLTPDDRRATIAFVSALASAGLRSDSLVVRFADVLEAEPAGRESLTPPALHERVQKSLTTFRHRPLRLRLAATWAARLGLVEVSADAVRFHHSILQAYLGSLVLDSLIDGDDYLAGAVKGSSRPGREFLIALVFLSRRQEHVEIGSAGSISPNPLPGFSRPEPERMRFIVESLTTEAENRKDNKSLDLYAAALEIDSINRLSIHPRIAESIRTGWPDTVAPDMRTLDEAKLGLVHRFGDALRQLQRRRDIAPSGAGSVEPPAYAALFGVGCLEEWSYAVRHAVAQELGSCGQGAFQSLRSDLDVGRVSRKGIFYTGEESWRRAVMRASLAPLLLGSVNDPGGQAEAQQNLRRWIEHVGAQDAHRPRPPLPPSIELALAQGFTYAANRRRHHPHMNPDARSYLVEQAADLLERSSFWPAQLTLIHALCLWALPDVAGSGNADGGAGADSRRGAARARIRGWLASAGTHGAVPSSEAGSRQTGGAKHPFVEEAAALAEWALETGQPERFVWIDVFGVTSRIGSRAAGSGGIRQHTLWIPPSVGWSALDPRAQQLVADVLLLINLADRGEQAEDRERRLRRAERPDLPPCLKENRKPLQPERAVSASDVSGPGSNCVGGCPFGLCPYPPKSGQSYRTEMSDAFCRRQQTLLSRQSRLRPRVAPWQGVSRDDLSQFWAAMALRARR